MKQRDMSQAHLNVTGPRSTESHHPNKELRVLVVDDEPLARDELVFLLEQCSSTKVIGQAQSAPEALRFCESETVDLAFVDLRMPGPDGIALAESMHRKHPHMHVVLVSAHDDGAVRAFEARVFDYLLKPVRLERLQQTLERILEKEAQTPKEPEPRQSEKPPLDRLAVRRRGSYVVIETADILYFEVKDELVWAVTEEDRYALDLTLTAVEQQMPQGDFFRSHRGYLVRIDRIRSIEPVGGGLFNLRVEHKDNPAIPLARERARGLRGLIPFAG